MCGNSKIILCIIACLYDVLVQNGLTALHICIIGCHLNVMRALVNEFHLDPDVVDKVSIMLCHMCVYEDVRDCKHNHSYGGVQWTGLLRGPKNDSDHV